MAKAKSRRTILQQMADRPGRSPGSSIFDAPPRFGQRTRVLPTQVSPGTGPPFEGASREILTGVEGIGKGLSGFFRSQAPGARRVTGTALVKDVLNSRELSKLGAVLDMDPKVLGNKPSGFLQRNTSAVEKALGATRAVTLSLTMGLVGAVSPLGRSKTAVSAIRGAPTLLAFLRKGPKAWLAGFRELTPVQQAATAKKLIKETARLEPAAARLLARAPGTSGKIGGARMAADAKALRDAVARLKALAAKTTVTTTAKTVAPIVPLAKVVAPAGGKLGARAASAAKNVAQAAQAAPSAAIAGAKGLGRPGFTRRALTALKNRPGKFGTAVMATWLADMIVGGIRGPEKGGVFRAIGSLFDPETTRGTPKTPAQVEAEAGVLKGAVEGPAATSRFKQLLRTRRFKRGLTGAAEEEAVSGFETVLLAERTKAIERLEKRMTKFKQANPDVPPAVAIRILNKRAPALSEIIEPPDADTEAELTLYDTIADFLQSGSPPDRRENTDLLNRANASAPGGIGDTGATE